MLKRPSISTPEISAHAAEVASSVFAALVVVAALAAPSQGASNVTPPTFVVLHALSPTFGPLTDRFLADGAPGLIVFTLDGTPLDTLGAGDSPDWSADGLRVATFNPSRMYPSVISFDLSNGNTSGGWNVWPYQSGSAVWHPSGASLLFATPSGLESLPYPPGPRSPIPCSLPGGGNCGSAGACFSPNGASIVFAQGTSLWRVDAAGGTAARLLDGSLRTGWQSLHTPAWSSDGAWIAFAVDAVPGHGIWVVNALGEDSGSGPLTEWLTPQVFGIDWRPGSNEIYFGLDFQVWKTSFNPSVGATPSSWGAIKSIYH